MNLKIKFNELLCILFNLRLGFYSKIKNRKIINKDTGKLS